MGDLGLPSGRVTLMFTDIEGSTRLLIERGEGYRALLETHHRAIRSAIRASDGVEVGSEGDSFFVVFPDAVAALRAAVAAQAALGGEVSVRMGIHTGEPALTEHGYVGLDVHRAARISAAAHGGQILLSRATLELVEGAGIAVRDLGEHRLKDLEEPEWLFQVGDGDFPPVRSLSVTNLPSRSSSFVGRHRELAAAGALLAGGRTRLLTLVGSGGVGKTSLAVELARGLAEAYPNGVFFVACAALREPSRMLPEIARVVGAPENGLTERLAGRRMLVVVDNLEQIVDSAARELSLLLKGTDRVDVIATSREPLRIDGEHTFEVPPLSGEDAEVLFLERCAAAGAAVPASAAVEQLVARLDGLPLALELAAARVRLLAPEQLLVRLEQRLDLLVGKRDTEERHATLRTAIEWSYDLLSEPERRLFARLAVFAGGCTLELAEQVCDASLDTLGGLVDKSLLRRSEHAAGRRFWMLETIRAFAGERLTESGQEEDIRRLHATMIARLVEDGSPAISGADPPPEWVARVSAELDNLRAAIQSTRASGHDELLSRLVAFAWPVTYTVGLFNEFAQWLEDAIECCPDRARTARLALALAGNAYVRGSYEQGVQAAEQALELTRSLDGELAVEALDQMAINCAMLAEHERAAALLEEALALARIEPPRDERLFLLLVNVSGTALARRDYDRALEASQEAIDLAERVWPGLGGPPVPLLNRGFALLECGQPAAARRSLERSLRTSLELPLQTGIAYAFLGLAAVAAADGDAVAAARLAGTADGVADEAGLSYDPFESDLHARTLAFARTKLGPEFNDWYTAGHKADPVQIAQLALANTQPI
jgi:predicted ATPase/class 3 adenylate cyclase